MAIQAIRHYPDPVLNEVTEPVAQIDEALRQLVRDMVETMYAAPGVGLAAPQIGVLKRVAVLDTSGSDAPSQLIEAVNPYIVERDGKAFEEEGCLSVPGYYAHISRSSWVRVRYQDLAGQEHEVEAEGLQAIAFQHELDHLDGILFIDHLSPLKRSMFRKRYAKLQQRQKEQL